MAIQGTPLIDVELDLAYDTVDSIAEGTFVGALLPEGDHLEPTTGQIWPRIG